MDLIKKFLPKQKTIQSFKVDPQGFRKTINENPPTQEFFKNPPEGAEHGQKCIESKKINTLYYKKPAATPTFCKRNFSRMYHSRDMIFFPVAVFGYKFLKLQLEKFRLQKVGVKISCSRFAGWDNFLINSFLTKFQHYHHYNAITLLQESPITYGPTCKRETTL